MRQLCLVFLISITSIGVASQDATCQNQQLAYIAPNEQGHDDIFVANIDGTDERNLTNDNLSEVAPKWSPDGLQIAFTISIGLDEDVETNALTIINADGNDRRSLYTHGYVADPQWSPDGRYIAFTSTSDGPRGISVIAADGSNPQHYDVATLVEAYDWSPDSQYLAVQAQDEMRHRDIYLVTVEDGTVRRLTHTDLASTAPTWTPDAQITYIAYNEVPEIHILDPFTANLSSQTFLSNSTAGPILWSPVIDSNEAVLVDQGDIWLYRAGELTNLTQDPDDALWVDWSPDGQYLAYMDLTYRPEISIGVNVLEIATGKKDRIRDGADMPDWRPC
jgi:Tol biopolymer transport system component